MPALLSAVLSTGLLLIYLALVRSGTAKPPRPMTARLIGRWLTRAGADEVGPRELLLSSAVVGLAVAIGTQALLHWPVLTLAAGGAGTLLPSWYFQHRSLRRRTAVEEAVPEAVDALRDATRVGIGLEETLRTLGRTGPLPLRATFLGIDHDLRFEGLESALVRARERVADPGFDTLVAALLMSYRVGGRNLGQVLDGLGRSVRAAARTRREIEATQAQNVLSARVIAALPLVLLVTIRATNPGYLSVFSSPTGQAMLALCLVSVVAGYAGMLRATRLPNPTRLLR